MMAKMETTKIHHLITENTDFLEIIRKKGTPGGSYFISNILPLLSGYKNSSFEVHEQTNPPTQNFVTNIMNWKLPYKSTIVVPIRPLKLTKNENEDIIGFLCVDSEKMFAFRKKYDCSMLKGIADGIYNTLNRYKQSKHTKD